MDWKTEKALLEQETYLLEMQLQELREREDSYKIFNETILNAYNSIQNDVQKQNSNIYKQLQQSLEQFSKDLIEQKNKNAVMLSQLEKENRNLKDYIELLELQIQEQKQEQQRELLEFEEAFSIFQQQPDPTIIIERKSQKIQDKENNKPEAGQSFIIQQKLKNKELIAKELSLSKNILNCKNSNLLEFSKIDQLDQSSSMGLFKQYQLTQRVKNDPYHTQRQMPQLSKRETQNQRESKILISPSQNKHDKLVNIITLNELQVNDEFRLITSNQLLQKDIQKNEKSQIKHQKKSLEEFTRQINSFKSNNYLLKSQRRSQLF